MATVTVTGSCPFEDGLDQPNDHPDGALKPLSAVAYGDLTAERTTSGRTTGHIASEHETHETHDASWDFLDFLKNLPEVRKFLCGSATSL